MVIGIVLDVCVAKQGSMNVENLDKLVATDAQADDLDLDPGLLGFDDSEDLVTQCDANGCELVYKAPPLWIC